MYKDKTVCVVVPAHNEELLIAKVIETMPDIVDKIVIVDDCSQDKTAEIVKAYENKSDRVVLIQHEKNQGVGGAIATGYKWARDHEYDATAVMAGDAQMCPNDLPALLDPIVSGEADYCKGNRLFTGEAYRKIPKVRYFGNSILSLLTKVASGYWHVSDSQTGYAVINLAALKMIDWDSMYKRYGQPNDLLIKLNVYGFKVKDVPIEPVYNVGERSGIKVKKVVFTISRLLVKGFFWRLKEKYFIRDFHPLILFYSLGFFLLAVSGLLAARLVYLWVDTGHVPHLTMLALLFSMTMCLQSSFFAMWMDADYNRSGI